MKLILKLITIFLLSFISTFASEKQIENIANISAVSLYNIDKNSLQKTIEVYVKTHPNLKALKIVEILTGETYIEFYKEKEKLIYKEIPKNFSKQLIEFNYISKYENESVGKVTAYFENEELTTLSYDEKQWLKENKITLSVDNSYAPMNFMNKNNLMDGLSIDYIKLIEKKIGTKITLDINKWPISLSNAMEHKTDGIINANRTSKRDEKLIFTKPYITVPMALITSNKSDYYNSLSQLENKTILIKEKTVEASVLPKKYPKLKFKEIKTYKEALHLISAEKAFGLFGHSAVLEYQINKYLLPNLKNNFVTFDDVITKQSIGIKNTAPLLKTILDKAILSISSEEKRNINIKWIGDYSSSNAQLTKDEKSWLMQNSHVNIAVVDTYPPYDFRTQNNKLVGFHSDLVKVINENLGIRIKLVPYSTWNDAYTAALEGRVHGIFSLSWSEKREKEHFIYSPAYHFSPYYLVVKNNNTNIMSLSDLSDKKIAVEKNTIFESVVLEKSPKSNILLVENTKKAYESVEKSETLATISPNINDELFKNSDLKIAFEIFHKSSNLHIGVNKKYPIVASIVEKAINSISLKQISALRQNWLTKSSATIELSPNEKDWVKNNPNVKVIEFFDEAPFTINSKEKSGYVYELVEYLVSSAGLKIDYINAYKSYDEMLSSLNKGEVDILTTFPTSLNLGKDTNIEKSSSILKTPFVLVGKTNESLINSMNDLDGKKVAVVKGYIQDTYLNAFPKIKKVYVNNNDEGFRAIRNEKADYYINNRANSEFILNKSFSTDLKIVYELAYNTFPPFSISFAMNKKNKELVSILNKALEQIPYKKVKEIKEKWIVHTTKHSSKVQLSNAELEFIKNNPKIKVHNEKSWPPFNYYEFGQAKGYSVELMKLVARNTGLNVEFISGPTWDEFLTKMKKDELDVIINIVKNKKREEYMLFTDPFIQATMGIAIHKDTKDISSFKEILEKKVALENGFFYHDYFNKNHPKTKLEVVDNGIQTLQSVSFKKADATIGFVPVMKYISSKNFIQDLRYLTDTSSPIMRPMPLRFSTRKDKPELLSILQKGLASITLAEQKELNSRWLGEDEKKEIEKLVLTKEEQKWLDKQNKIDIGIQTDWAPLSYLSNGTPSGLGVDYLNLINKRINGKLNILANDFKSNYDDVKNLKLDALIDITPLKKREEYFWFTSQYADIPHYIISKKENSDIYSHIREVRDKVIAIEKGYGLIKKLKEINPKIKLILFDNSEDAISAVSEGKADVYIGNGAVINFYLEKNFITNIKFHSRSSISKSVLAIGVSKDKKILRDILDKALLSISKNEKKQIYNKYIARSEEIKVNLNENEEAWLDKKIPVKYVFDPDWAPFEWKNELNEHTGIIYDILRLVSERTGIDLEAVPVDKWSDAVELAQSRKVDMYGGLGENEERKKYMNFTNNVLYKTPYVFVVHKDNEKDYFDTFNSLSKDEQIAVVNGYTIHGIMKDKQADIPLKTVVNTMEGFEQVTKKKIDIFLVNASTAKYYINRKGFDDLKIATKTEYQLEIKSAIRKDWPKEVISIIDKGLESISEKELADLYLKWTKILIEKDTDWSLLYKVIGGAFAILILITYWNRKLKKSVDLKTSELKTLLSSFDENVIASKTNSKGIITYASKAFCEISGYTLEELIGSPQNIVRHPDMPKELFKDLWTTIKSGKSWRGEVKNKKKNGGFYWVEVVIEPEFDEDKKIVGFSAIRQDITSKVEVEELSESLEQKVKDRTLALQESQEQFSSMSANVPGVIYRCKVDENWTMLYISNEIEVLSKYPVSDFLNNKVRTFADIMHEDDKEYVAKLIQEQIDKGEKFIVDYRVIDKDGVIKWVRSQGQAYESNESEKWIDGVLFDVTEQKKLEEEIIESQKRFGTLFDAAPDSIILIKNGQIIDCNKKTLEIFGVKSRKDFSEIDFKKLSPEFQDNNLKSEILAPQFMKKAITKGFYQFEWKHKRIDNGKVFDAEVILASMKINNEIHIYGVVRDISERKKAQQKIADQKQYIDSIMNSQSNIVISTDGEKLRTANKAFFDFFKVKDVEEFLESIGDCICDTFDTSATDGFVQKMMGEEKWIEYVYNRPNKINKTIIEKDGEKHIFTITSDRFEFAGEILEVAVFTDITEIEEIRKNIETILSNIMLPVLITSKEDRKILYANDYASIQYEAPIEELIGSSIDSVYTSLEQKDEILEIMRSQGYVENLEEVYRTRTGKEFTGLLSVKPIVYNGEDAYIGMVVDITVQKQIEAEIRQIHKHTQSSIEYASLIQHSLIPSNDLFRKYFSDYFTIWHPKDIVGGDIYLFEELRNDDECLIMVIDCTGHGVPGAFVTMLVKAIERQIAALIASNPNEEVSPAWILQYFNQTMKKLLKQEDDDAISNAGFDGAVFYYNKKEEIVKFSGAELPLFYFEDEKLQIIKGDRHSIGYKKSNADYEFKEHTFKTKKGMQFYLTTDGYFDQNGGDKGFPFGKKKFQKILETYQNYTHADQQEVLLNELADYQKDEERNDDITVVGIKI